MSNPIHIAIASPLGGVGKTTLTVLAASTLHYHLGYSVAVIDCNYPLYTTAYLRGKEAEGQKQGFSDKSLKIRCGNHYAFNHIQSFVSP